MHQQIVDRFGDLVLEVSAVEEEKSKVVLGLDVALDAPVDTFEVSVLDLVVLIRYLDLLDALQQLSLWLIPLLSELLCSEIFLALVLLIKLVEIDGPPKVEQDVA